MKLYCFLAYSILLSLYVQNIMGRKKKWNGDKELNYMDNETPPLSPSSPWLLIDLRIVAFQLRQQPALEASTTGYFVGPCQTLQLARC